MSLTAIRPSVHVVKDTPVARMFRRRIGFDDIMTFWSAETGQWILAYWLNRRLNLVEEMEDLGMVFEKVTPELVQSIVSCWKRVDWGKKKKLLLAKQRDLTRKQNEALLADQERWDWMKKKCEEHGKNPLPYAYGTPISGGETLPCRPIM